MYPTKPNNNPASFRTDVASPKPELSAEQTRIYERAIAYVNKSMNNPTQRQQYLDAYRDKPELAINLIQGIERQQAIDIMYEEDMPSAVRNDLIDRINIDPAYALEIVQMNEAELANKCMTCTIF